MSSTHSLARDPPTTPSTEGGLDRLLVAGVGAVIGSSQVLTDLRWLALRHVATDPLGSFGTLILGLAWTTIALGAPGWAVLTRRRPDSRAARTLLWGLSGCAATCLVLTAVSAAQIWIAALDMAPGWRWGSVRAVSRMTTLMLGSIIGPASCLLAFVAVAVIRARARCRRREGAAGAGSPSTAGDGSVGVVLGIVGLSIALANAIDPGERLVLAAASQGPVRLSYLAWPAVMLAAWVGVAVGALWFVIAVRQGRRDAQARTALWCASACAAVCVLMVAASFVAIWFRFVAAMPPARPPGFEHLATTASSAIGVLDEPLVCLVLFGLAARRWQRHRLDVA